jgi:hypothetical protein
LRQTGGIYASSCPSLARRAHAAHHCGRPPPAFPLPLAAGDPEPAVGLGPLLHALYDCGGYDLRLSYRTEADPPLSAEDAAWAAGLLHAAGLR